MRIVDVMRSPVATMNRDATVGETIITLADHQISAVPVVDPAGRMLGVISTTDVMEAEAMASDQAAREQLFNETRVEELMTPRPLTIAPDADVRDAARQMLYGDVHRLFVEEDGRPIGVITRTDIVRAFAIQRA
jgi:CBS domain-containing protein